MRAADARRAASTITSSSIRLSFAGGQVDCTMKTSRPRTFSISSILISPSLKRPTDARPSGICRLRSMSCDNAGVALPANSASVSLVLIRVCAARPLPPASTCELAGVEGFEPPNGGIKTRCLTTWRHPSASARAENSAGAHLTAASGAPSALPKLFVHRRAVQAARDEAHPAVRHARRQPLSFGCAAAGGKDTRPGAGELGAPFASEPIDRRRHLGQTRAHYRLAIVVPARLKKGAYCDEGGISCQFRALEHLSGADTHTRIDDDVPGFRERNRGQALPDPFRPGRETSNENRHIRAERECQAGKIVEAQTAAPQLVQCEKRRRGIRAAAPQPPTLRDALVYPQVGALPRAAHPLQGKSRPERKVGVRSYPGGTHRPFDQPIRPQ